ncbi:hypothetical protein GCM10023340_01340 [Nocardioides marinquilinus]|uniref:Sulfotransferase family protein n=1 Tax=Nocardioides marinquilinus TaxID=1210400 RepID=A0ABP9P5M2_9ACTN
MSRTVYLHVGAPKTGTTYLQDRLALNAATLAEHGVHVPARNRLVSPALSHFRAALDLLGQDWGGAPGHARGSWNALMRRVSRLEGTVVISHEILAPAAPEVVARVRADLAAMGDTELHVVYSARDLGRQLPAAWQESIKQGRRWSYRRYLRKVQQGKPWFARAFDLPSVLETWGEGLPREHVHVVTVPHERGDELWHRFCRAFGIDPAWAPRESRRTNPSLGVAETVMLRHLNRRIDRVTRREAAFDQLLRDMLAQDQLVNRRSRPLLLPPRLHPWAVERAEAWIEWLAQSGVDVVGDPADLLPGPRATRRAYVDPDAVGPRPQLAAALDALAAMTHEAARRPDPTDRLVVKARDRLLRRD